MRLDEQEQEPRTAFEPPWPIAKFAETFNISPITVTSYAKEGRLRVIRIGNRKYVPASEVKRVLEEGI